MDGEHEEQEEERKSIVPEGVSDWTVMKMMYGLFGVRRTVELIGWAFLWDRRGVTSLRELRRDLEAQGLSSATQWRATADFRKLQDALEEMEGRSLSVREVLRRMKDSE